MNEFTSSGIKSRLSTSIFDCEPFFLVKKYTTIVRLVYPNRFPYIVRAKQYNKTIKTLNEWQSFIGGAKNVMMNLGKIALQPTIEFRYKWGNDKILVNPVEKTTKISDTKSVTSVNWDIVPKNQLNWGNIKTFGNRAFFLPLGLFNTTTNLLSGSFQYLFKKALVDAKGNSWSNSALSRQFLNYLSNSLLPVIVNSENATYSTIVSSENPNNSFNFSRQSGNNTENTITHQVNIKQGRYSEVFTNKNQLNLEFFTKKNNLWFYMFKRYLAKWTKGTEGIFSNSEKVEDTLVDFVKDAMAAATNGKDSLVADKDGQIKNNVRMEYYNCYVEDWNKISTNKNEPKKCIVNFELKNHYTYLVNYYSQTNCFMNSKIAQYNVNPGVKGNNGVTINLTLEKSNQKEYEYYYAFESKRSDGKSITKKDGVNPDVQTPGTNGNTGTFTNNT